MAVVLLGVTTAVAPVKTLQLASAVDTNLENAHDVKHEAHDQQCQKRECAEIGRRGMSQQEAAKTFCRAWLVTETILEAS